MVTCRWGSRLRGCASGVCAVAALFGAALSVVTAGEMPEDLRDDVLRDARVILLGERHDHPGQHENQARWLERIAQMGSVAVVMEMVSTAQMATLHDTPATVAAWETGLAWETSGWPEFAVYAPIFDVIARHQIPVVAGTFSKAGQRMGDMAANLKSVLTTQTDPPPPVAAAIADAVREGHCDLLPEEMVAPMVEVQWLKDAYMAEALVQWLDEVDRVVLIAGNGHTQSDSGVPVHLGELAAETLAVVQVESADVPGGAASHPTGEATGQATKPGGFAGREIRVQTPPIPMPDHCAALKAHFGASSAPVD